MNLLMLFCGLIDRATFHPVVLQELTESKTLLDYSIRLSSSGPIESAMKDRLERSQVVRMCAAKRIPIRIAGDIFIEEFNGKDTNYQVPSILTYFNGAEIVINRSTFMDVRTRDYQIAFEFVALSLVTTPSGLETRKMWPDETRFRMKTVSSKVDQALFSNGYICTWAMENKVADIASLIAFNLADSSAAQTVFATHPTIKQRFDQAWKWWKTLSDSK